MSQPDNPDDHDCREHLEYRHHEWVETHGLDCGPYERGRDQWWECAVCGDKFTEQELEEINRSEWCDLE